MGNLPQEPTSIQTEPSASSPEQFQQPSQDKWWKIGFLATLLLFLATAGVLGFYVFRGKRPEGSPLPTQVPRPIPTLAPTLTPTLITPVSTPTPIPEVTPTLIPEPTADWRTYTSPDGLYSFKYPLDWLVNTGESPLAPFVYVMCDGDLKVNSCNRHGDTVDLFQVVRVIYNAVDEYLEKYKIYTDYRKTTFGGDEAVQLVVPGGPQAGGSTLVVFVVHKGKGYELQDRYPGLLDAQSLGQFGDPRPNILSTFKFSN